MESSVSRKVVVYTKSHNDAEGLLVWVFNPDIYYSSSKRGPTVYRAMKIFYKVTSDPVKILEDDINSFEELILQPEDLKDFIKSLEDSADVLPQSAREFQDWRIGLLDRYEKSPTGPGAMDQNPLSKKPADIDLFAPPPEMKALYE